MYWKIYRAWLLKLLNERIYLSSKKGFLPELEKPAKELKTLIDHNGYRTDRTLAGFITRKYEKIEQFIPKNSAYETQILTLKTALEKGQGHLE